jgi:hypothetical protein
MVDLTDSNSFWQVIFELYAEALIHSCSMLDLKVFHIIHCIALVIIEIFGFNVLYGFYFDVFFLIMLVRYQKIESSVYARAVYFVIINFFELYCGLFQFCLDTCG